MKFADIIIPLAVDGIFTYSVPVALESVLEAGMAVVVPFAGNKRYTGIVYRLHEQQPVGYKVRPIEDIAEKDICFSEKHLRFLLWLSEYYMSAPGDALRAALPVAFRLESHICVILTGKEQEAGHFTVNETILLNFLQPGQYVALKEIEKILKLKNVLPVVKSLLDRGYIEIKESIDDVFKEKTEKIVKWAGIFGETELGRMLDALKRARVQYDMLCQWIAAGEQELEKQQFFTKIGHSPAALKALCDKGILQITERAVSRLVDDDNNAESSHALSEEQHAALDQIRTIYDRQDCALLHGVTSSGKTEIYIHLIEEYINSGRQVLYMLPEIALTVQIIKRLKRVFGDRIGVYHSGMPDNVRAEMWKKQCSGQPYQIVLGVRSSVFLPFTDLGLVIIDEEHDASYKQKEPAPRYNGRDAAIMLGKLYAAKILLGSATPSFETYRNARSGKYGYVRLEHRYGNVSMPEVLFADLAEYKRKKMMKGVFSPLLLEEMKKVLEAGKQVILFQNRRGYSTYLQCDQCGAVLKCRHCDVSMTYYKQRNVMSCRYCGSLRGVSDVCDTCGKGHYKQRTPGTERIEEEVAGLFPGARVARMDLEVMSSKSKFRQLIEDFEKEKIDILIGTQMVSKGLDFANVKLVGVIDADSMVNFPDFRAEERAYCMLLQVSGRSGRKGERGKVVIQTADRKNKIYSMLSGDTYDNFYTEQTEERKMFAYPPFCRIIQVELRHKEVVSLRNAANLLAGRLREVLGRRVCGPAVPDVSMISGLHRIQFILKIEPETSVSKVKILLKNEFVRLHKDNRNLRIFCDVDPVN